MAEIIPVKPDQGNACAGRFHFQFPLLSAFPFHYKNLTMKTVILFFLVIVSIRSYSQEKDSSDLVPVEVRAVRASSTAPFAKTNISKKEIASQNLGQDLPFLLNQT